MYNIEQNTNIYTVLSKRFNIAEPIIRVICNYPFRFANSVISDDLNNQSIMFAYLFKIKPKKQYIHEIGTPVISDN